MKGEHTMTERMIENRVKKLQTIEAQMKELEAQAEKVKAEIKADLEGKIRLYVTTEGLSTQQYKELLGMYPVGELEEL